MLVWTCRRRALRMSEMSALYVLGDRQISYEDGVFLTDPENRAGMPQLYECAYCKEPIQWFSCDGDVGALCNSCYRFRTCTSCGETPERLVAAAKRHPLLIAVPELDPTFAGKHLLTHGKKVQPIGISHAKGLVGTMRTDQV